MLIFYQKLTRLFTVQYPQLVKAGIPGETIRKIKGHYQKLNGKKPGEVLMISSAVFGSILIGLGVISIFAHNWYQLEKMTRAVISFFPVLIGGGVYMYTLFKKAKSKVWVEASSVFLFLMIGASFSLITQIFHMGGSAADLLFWWLILSIPLMYIMNSTLSAVCFLITLIYWAQLVHWSGFSLFRGGFESSGEVLWFWLLIMAVVPHFLNNYRQSRTSLRIKLLGYVSSYTLVSTAYATTIEHHMMGAALIIALVYLLGKLLYDDKVSIWNRPFQFIALWTGFGYMFYLSNTFMFKTLIKADGYLEKEPSIYGGLFNGMLPEVTQDTSRVFALNWVILIVLAAAVVSLAVYMGYNQKKFNYVFVLAPLVLLIAIFLGKSDHFTMVKVLINLYIITVAVYYLFGGIKYELMEMLAVSLVLFGFLALIRYFDSEFDFLLKGLIYIISGGAFIMFNYYVSLYLDSKSEVEKDE